MKTVPSWIQLHRNFDSPFLLIFLQKTNARIVYEQRDPMTNPMYLDSIHIKKTKFRSCVWNMWSVQELLKISKIPQINLQSPPLKKATIRPYIWTHSTQFAHLQLKRRICSSFLLRAFQTRNFIKRNGTVD